MASRRRRSLKARKGSRKASRFNDLQAARMEVVYRKGIKAGRVSRSLSLEIWRIGERSVRKVEGDILKIPGIAPDVFEGIDSTKSLAKFRRTNVDLIKDLTQQQREAVSQTLQNFRDARPKELAEELRRVTGVSQAKSDLWARDQTLKYHSQIDEARGKTAGLEHYIWRTAGPGDERTRESHAALEGLRFHRGNPPEVGHPGEDYQCRCIREWVLT